VQCDLHLEYTLPLNGVQTVTCFLTGTSVYHPLCSFSVHCTQLKNTRQHSVLTLVILTGNIKHKCKPQGMITLDMDLTQGLSLCFIVHYFNCVITILNFHLIYFIM
jgi:hypothetical protein